MNLPRHIATALAALAPITALAQQTANGAAAETTVKTKSLLAELSAPSIIPLWFCSAVIVYLVIDLYLKTAHKQCIRPAAVATLRQQFRDGAYQDAFTWTEQHPSPLANVIHAGLRHSPNGKQAAEDAMAIAIVGENTSYQNRIAYLSVIGVIAPMIGLTGTVIGMISAFASMSQAGAADPSKLSGAIGHVLHATASGLAVAIPAFVFYYLIRNRVTRVIHELSIAATDLFRKFPYEHLEHVEFTGGETYAGLPNWLRPQTEQREQPAAEAAPDTAS
ncbi:MotA/TolQ/ExbB proton channel family protein [Geminisphaera colitermitum]|uniref:MotA/TolQ/ExbB proton channel family protein n=1 Tax=Geminisphaera colitermitum TaxID=1148786 RepID=UPI000158C6A5|nr:MotA/TolQ/ExbB proton channel family protein [Geminisphaera colitermitum]